MTPLPFESALSEITINNVDLVRAADIDQLPKELQLEFWDELLSNLVYGIRPRSCLIDPVLVRRP